MAAGPWRADCPALAGHTAGVEALRRIVEAAPGLGIGVLTLFAFSSDNWRRPPEEVAGLMRLLAEHLRSETARALDNGVRIEVIGRRDRLGDELAAAIARRRILRPPRGTRLHLRIAVDYSGRDAIAEAVRQVAHAGLVCRECLEEQLGPPVDLLIRTGGEQRLSDFLLWECAYAELIFSRRMWPDFDAADLECRRSPVPCTSTPLWRTAPCSGHLVRSVSRLARLMDVGQTGQTIVFCRLPPASEPRDNGSCLDRPQKNDGLSHG